MSTPREYVNLDEEVELQESNNDASYANWQAMLEPDDKYLGISHRDKIYENVNDDNEEGSYYLALSVVQQEHEEYVVAPYCSPGCVTVPPQFKSSNSVCDSAECDYYDYATNHGVPHRQFNIPMQVNFRENGNSFGYEIATSSGNPRPIYSSLSANNNSQTTNSRMSDIYEEVSRKSVRLETSKVKEQHIEPTLNEAELARSDTFRIISDGENSLIQKSKFVDILMTILKAILLTFLLGLGIGILSIIVLFMTKSI